MRNDRKADILFALSASAFAAAFVVRLHNDSLWASILYFLTQSAFIGSAADWFAVTALFKRPLGFPFHTELIPRHRERLILGIRRIIEEKLVRPELWETLAASVCASGWLKDFLTTEKGQKLRSLWIEAAEKEVRCLLEEKQEILASFAATYVSDLPQKFVPEIRALLLSPERMEKFLQGLLQGGNVLLAQPEIKAGLERALKDFVEMQKKNPLIAMAVSMGESMGVISYSDMAEAICAAGREKVRKWQEPELPFHGYLRDRLYEAARDFLQCPEMEEVLLRTAKGVLAELDIRQAAQDAEALLLREWEMEDCRRRSCGGLVRQMFDEAAERLLEDEENCKRLDDMFRDVCVRAALYEHAFIGETAEQVLSAYDKERLNDFIYSKVRDELGWIRINGTLVAAAAGSLLLSAFSAFHLIP